MQKKQEHFSVNHMDNSECRQSRSTFQLSAVKSIACARIRNSTDFSRLIVI